jgi:hypothetical protein
MSRGMRWPVVAHTSDRDDEAYCRDAQADLLRRSRRGNCDEHDAHEGQLDAEQQTLDYLAIRTYGLLVSVGVAQCHLVRTAARGRPPPSSTLKELGTQEAGVDAWMSAPDPA